jgi:hypothetical protein
MTAAMMIRCFNQSHFYRYANKQRCVQETSPASKIEFLQSPFSRKDAGSIGATREDYPRIGRAEWLAKERYCCS